MNRRRSCQIAKDFPSPYYFYDSFLQTLSQFCTKSRLSKKCHSYSMENFTRRKERKNHNASKNDSVNSS